MPENKFDLWYPPVDPPTPDELRVLGDLGEIPNPTTDPEKLPTDLKNRVESFLNPINSKVCRDNAHEGLLNALTILNDSINKISGSLPYTEAREKYLDALGVAVSLGADVGEKYVPVVIVPNPAVEGKNGRVGFPSLRVEGPVLQGGKHPGGNYYYSSTNTTCSGGYAARFTILNRLREKLKAESLETLEGLEQVIEQKLRSDD